MTLLLLDVSSGKFPEMLFKAATIAAVMALTWMVAGKKSQANRVPACCLDINNGGTRCWPNDNHCMAIGTRAPQRPYISRTEDEL
jgi:hypothetical protein